MTPRTLGDCPALVVSESGPPFTLIEPAFARRSRVVVTSPHSGRRYPSRFIERSALGLDALRQVEDAGMDQLLRYQPLPSPLLLAEYPRSYVDLNRAAGEIDAAMFDGPVELDGNRPGGHGGTRDGARGSASRYLRWGLGVIPGKAANQRDIYDAPLPASEAGERLERCYAPFHARLADLLGDASSEGNALLIDCHSMPSSLGGGDRSRGRDGDIVLGDGHGKTAESGLVARARAFFEREGLRVALNSPYAGGHITRHYGRPETGVSAIQVEVCRSLYLDEARISLKPGWRETASVLCRFVMAMDAGLDGG